MFNPDNWSVDDNGIFHYTSNDPIHEIMSPGYFDQADFKRDGSDEGYPLSQMIELHYGARIWTTRFDNEKRICTQPCTIDDAKTLNVKYC